MKKWQKKLADLAEVPKPKELLATLNEYVVGQDRAKRALAVAAYNHYAASVLLKVVMIVMLICQKNRTFYDWPNRFWQDLLSTNLS